MSKNSSVHDTLDLLEHILENPEFKKKLIDIVNEHIDIPMINEKIEERLLKKMYSAILKAIKDKND